ncbi:Alginate lyase [Granulicella rosea]|uniref:Alginate lyase n=1 Tax=Granulicella rosea TaxID=474952 RepID=A0A239DTQ1_9BACT|nr:alginate lyase family protein [Granulicella rosea]SNS36005.1 Alginate lyase [Granulicella rosea]
MRLKLWLAAATISLSAIQAIAQTPPKTFEFDGQQLLRLREQPNSPAVKAALAEADSAMHAGPFTVTAKPQAPPSGDKHDYMSLARYFWPNPATPNHLPYVRRDGQSNPQIQSIPDHEYLFKMEEAVHALALGYVLTGREEYAARATLLLRAWFLDPKTKMNPNLQYAQAVLGVNGGRGRGILDARGLPDVTDAVAMIEGSKSWTAVDDDGIRGWFNDYYTWLTKSDNGRDEADAKNNHASWYDFQAVGIALFLGRQGDARAMLLAARTRRIAPQIDADGKQPLELGRTKSFGYSVFNLEALMRLADYGAAVGVDLWKYQAPGGGSIRAALDYLIPFALNKERWSHEDITGFNGDELRLPLLQAAARFHEPAYLAAADRLKGKETAEMLILRSRVAP